MDIASIGPMVVVPSDEAREQEEATRHLNEDGSRTGMIHSADLDHKEEGGTHQDTREGLERFMEFLRQRQQEDASSKHPDSYSHQALGDFQEPEANIPMPDLEESGVPKISIGPSPPLISKGKARQRLRIKKEGFSLVRVGIRRYEETMKFEENLSMMGVQLDKAA